MIHSRGNRLPRCGASYIFWRVTACLRIRRVGDCPAARHSRCASARFGRIDARIGNRGNKRTDGAAICTAQSRTCTIRRGQPHLILPVPDQQTLLHFINKCYNVIAPKPAERTWLPDNPQLQRHQGQLQIEIGTKKRMCRALLSIGRRRRRKSWGNYVGRRHRISLGPPMRNTPSCTD
jgi:hypothetical protein